MKGLIPSMLKPTARWKWEAWQKLKGIPRAKAMKRYLDLLKKVQPSWEKEAAKQKAAALAKQSKLRSKL